MLEEAYSFIANTESYVKAKQKDFAMDRVVIFFLFCK